MQQSEFVEIIRCLQAIGQEWKTVDAKQEISLKEVGAKAEFVKDIVAMANNGEPRFLVIGLEDGTFTPVGALTHHYNKNDLNQLLVDKIDPPLTVGYQEFTIDENEYAVIEIYGTNPPYIVARDLVHAKTDRKRVRIHKGTIYVRHEDRTEGISRSELEKYFKGGLRKAFEDETEYALQLALNQPEFWEYLLTAELLKSKLALIRCGFEDVEKGLVFERSTKMDVKDFISWIQERLNDFNVLMDMLTVSVNEEMPESWGKSGKSGDPLEIKKAVDRIASACNEFLKWEISFRSIIPPDVFLPVRQMMAGWTLGCFEQLETISGELLKPFEKEDPTGTYKLNIFIDSPANIEQIMAELKRFRMNPLLLVDE